MQRTFICFLLIALSLGLVACEPDTIDSPEAHLPATSFSAGAAEAIITPSKDPAAIHDDLYVRVLVLSDGHSRYALVTADLLVMWPAHVMEIKRGIEERTSIPVANITVNVSHTHNVPGPPPGEWEDGLTYHEWMTQTFIETAVQADAARVPAVLKVDRIPVQAGFNRRLPVRGGVDVWMYPNPNGPVIRYSDILCAYGAEDDKRIAVLFTYAAHPVIVHESSSKITADLPGATVRRLTAIVTGDGASPMEGVIMFGQGNGGNVNAYPLRGGFQACDVAGDKFATTIAMLIDAQELAPGRIRTASRTLQLPYATPPSVEEVEAMMERNPDDHRYNRLLTFAQEGPAEQFREYTIQATQLSDELVILAMPGETFCDYSLFAVDASPYEHTIVLGFSNGGDGYVGSRAAYELGLAGGYETALTGNSLGRNPPLPLDASVEEIIHEGIVELLTDLKRQP
jgi:neutral ceramidase